MKKLLVLTAVAILTASTVGCQCGRWFRRGTMVPCCPQPAACCDPCETMCAPAMSGCDSCATPMLGATPVPGPGTYVPAG